MVLLHIVCYSPEQATAIVDFLLEEKLVLHAIVSNKLVYKQLNDNKKESFEQILVMGTTKALLFTKINQRIQKKFTEHPPLIYAMPIIYMDELQGDTLRVRTEKV
ncbi:hypothetical protein KIM67_08325 [Flagellimonas sp. 389]|uniref:hypothetical protein n=1 Tax=Flagellimonas sp. 389 TaxID=2835862 RepID=UPI001BD1DB1F|nr:hypothetical protein [Flagellimonas sp. 389]MBS9462412.1 hypothetical protein [Flagellimonas sp. 389]